MSCRRKGFRIPEDTKKIACAVDNFIEKFAQSVPYADAKGAESADHRVVRRGHLGSGVGTKMFERIPAGTERPYASFGGVFFWRLPKRFFTSRL